VSQFEDNIRRAIVDEIRLCGLMNEPPSARPIPCDLDAEGELCSAVLGRFVKPQELPVRGGDFYSKLNGYIWTTCDAVHAAGLEVDLDFVVQALQADGVRGPIRDYLVELRDATPHVIMRQLMRQAERVAELARVRLLCAELAHLEVELRFERRTAEGALRHMRDLFFSFADARAAE
jgi:hypothetical protein